METKTTNNSNAPKRGNEESSQYRLAVLLTIFGVLLIVASFIAPPIGGIDPSVLTAFGEILTFCGSVIGIDYHYKSRSPS